MNKVILTVVGAMYLSIFRVSSNDTSADFLSIGFNIKHNIDVFHFFLVLNRFVQCVSLVIVFRIFSHVFYRMFLSEFHVLNYSC